MEPLTSRWRGSQTAPKAARARLLGPQDEGIRAVASFESAGAPARTRGEVRCRENARRALAGSGHGASPRASLRRLATALRLVRVCDARDWRTRSRRRARTALPRSRGAPDLPRPPRRARRFDPRADPLDGPARSGRGRDSPPVVRRRHRNDRDVGSLGSVIPARCGGKRHDRRSHRRSDPPPGGRSAALVRFSSRTER